MGGKMRSELVKMKEISAYAGSRRDFVQGGGGNTSVKVDGKQMVVKASGYLLKDVKEDGGYAWVDYQKVREYYKQGCKGEVLDAWIKKDRENLLPSIEMTFHSVLGRYVIHTHSVYANVLTCSVQGRAVAKRLFGEKAIWVPYQMPGDLITKEVLLALEKAGRAVEDENPIIIFMDNHGLIISANRAEDAIKTHEYINEVLASEFGAAGFVRGDVLWNEDEKAFAVKNDFTGDTNFKKLCQSENQSGVIFPDQLVYTHGTVKNFSYGNGVLLVKAGAVQACATFETIAAYDYIVTMILEQGYEVQYLAPKEIEKVLNNDQEKYRKEVIKSI